MRPLFGNSVLRKNDDVIRVPNRRKTMSDTDCCSRRSSDIKSFLNYPFRLELMGLRSGDYRCVERTGRFIEE
jgi:hypothetical protein